ncbi:MAG: hypothetical protein PHQ58_19275 [Rhodoferax sp.]|uniref:hypothetical protein n=1 Tax=Rhodoferax sp. TaxID=50421 RepID=UPI002608C7A1|nr:hypothetical protein [Rhodoferax sp.]MDD2882568.1 hypothetical protein [Rhodoferax sp.]
MYIVPIGWLYVAVLMAAAEATNTNGTVLGGLITFVLYGLLPVGLVVYVMGAPGRKRAIKAKEQAEIVATQAASSAASDTAPDAHAKTPTDPVTPVRKEA